MPKRRCLQLFCCFEYQSHLSWPYLQSRVWDFPSCYCWWPFQRSLSLLCLLDREIRSSGIWRHITG